MDLRGAVALVTRGSDGLGQRICHALAREGVQVAVVCAQSRDRAEVVLLLVRRVERVRGHQHPMDLAKARAAVGPPAS